MFVQGNLSLISAASLIQLLCQEQRSVSMVLRYNDRTARLTLAEGMVVTAHCHELRGAEAVYHVLHWPDGLFHIQPLAQLPAEIEIEDTWEGLLLEAARRRDEANLLS
jgi:hypothetical protein